MRYLIAVIIGLGLTLAPAKGADVPRRAPEFSVSMPSGKKLLLSSLRGKVVALEFLLTTCPGCARTSQELDKLYKDYGPRGFQPVGVAINDMAMLLVPEYVQKLRLTFPVGVGAREPVTEFLQYSTMMRMLVPQLVIIDRKGVIRAQYAGDDDFFLDAETNFRSIIEKLLKEPAS